MEPLKYSWHNPKFPLKVRKVKLRKCVKAVYTKEQAYEECQALRQEDMAHDWYAKQCLTCNAWHVHRSKVW